jgi:predicted amidophosphoribosyltransferase
MITALSFRIDTRNADIFRRWLMEQVTRSERNLQTLPPISVFVPMDRKTLPN